VRSVLAFVRGAYEFVAGDDWMTAVGVALALALTAVFDAAAAAWVITPLVVATMLTVSIWRACRTKATAGQRTLAESSASAPRPRAPA
jgi:hypothetical protein